MRGTRICLPTTKGLVARSMRSVFLRLFPLKGFSLPRTHRVDAEDPPVLWTAKAAWYAPPSASNPDQGSPFDSGVSWVISLMHDLNFVCADFKWEYDEVRCSNSYAWVSNRPHLTVRPASRTSRRSSRHRDESVRSRWAHLIELLFHLLQLRRIQVCELDLLLGGHCGWMCRVFDLPGGIPLGFSGGCPAVEAV